MLKIVSYHKFDAKQNHVFLDSIDDLDRDLAERIKNRLQAYIGEICNCDFRLEEDEGFTFMI